MRKLSFVNDFLVETSYHKKRFLFCFIIYLWNTCIVILHKERSHMRYHTGNDVVYMI